mgnify:CR=1 FL=1
MSRKLDGIELEILWSNLIGIVSEQAKALQRIAFSPIVREAGDLASALFDALEKCVKTEVRWIEEGLGADSISDGNGGSGGGERQRRQRPEW